MSACLSGRGAVWLACYLGVVEVAGSSPVAPTIYFISSKLSQTTEYSALIGLACYSVSTILYSAATPICFKIISFTAKSA